MRAIDKDAICRVNCPGYGTELNLTPGSANELSTYKVLVVNPVSILHLFDSPEELRNQVHEALAKGASSLPLANKDALLPIAPALLLRYWELEQFLLEGGLLIYFLCQPFVVANEDCAFDNYAFLDLLGPERQKDDGKRHMTAIQKGRHGDLAPGAEFSPFANYLKIGEVEWHTLIRSENLTEGYDVLAMAAPNKCIAGVKSVGNRGGQIIFLPAPYLEHYDAQLLECIELWHESKLRSQARKEVYDPQGKEGIMTEAEEKTNEMQASAPQGAPQNDPNYPEPEPEAAPPYAIPHKRHAPHSEPHSSDSPKILMGKLEEASKPPCPDWCRDYQFSELAGLHDELIVLKEQMRSYETKMARLDYLVGTMESLKQGLLWSSQEELVQACHQCFQKIGFEVQEAENRPHELHLYEDGKPSAIAYVVRSEAAAGRAHLAHLLQAQADFWRQHGTEPKGFLVANLFAETPPEERYITFADDLDKYAQGKGMCLFTSMQLLCMWKDVELGHVMADDARQELLARAGTLPGYVLNRQMLSVQGSEKL